MAAPELLHVVAPPKPKVAGYYHVIPGMQVNGMPVWGCGPHRLYATSFGNWGIGFQEDSPMKNTAWIVSRSKISSCLPHTATSWKYNDGNRWVPSDDICIIDMSATMARGSPQPLQGDEGGWIAPLPSPAGAAHQLPRQSPNRLAHSRDGQSDGWHPGAAVSTVAGARVRREPSNWTYGDQDGGGDGTLLHLDEAAGIATVRWDCGGVRSYRYGQGGVHEVCIVADALSQTGVVSRGEFEALREQVLSGQQPGAVTQEEFSQLAEQCRELHSGHEALATQHAELSEAHSTLTDQCRDLHSAHEGLATQHEALQEGHTTLTDQCRDLHTAHEGLATAHEGLTTAHEGLAEGHRSLVEQCRELHSSHEGLATQHEALAEGHNSLTEQCRELHSAHEGLTTQHEALAEGHNGLTEQCRELHSAHMELTAQHEQLAEGHSSLTEQCRELHSEVTSAADRITALESGGQNLQELAEEHRKLQTSHFALQGQCDDLRRDLAAVMQRMLQLENAAHEGGQHASAAPTAAAPIQHAPAPATPQQYNTRPAVATPLYAPSNAGASPFQATASTAQLPTAPPASQHYDRYSSPATRATPPAPSTPVRQSPGYAPPHSGGSQNFASPVQRVASSATGMAGTISSYDPRLHTARLN